MYPNRYPFEQLKTVRLQFLIRSVCDLFKIDQMPFEQLGLSVQNYIQPLKQLLLSIRMAEVIHSKKGSPLND